MCMQNRNGLTNIEHNPMDIIRTGQIRGMGLGDTNSHV